MIQALAIIGIGIAIYFSSDWFARLYSHRADKSERDGVVRYGGLSGKVWREDEPEKFASRIETDRAVAVGVRWFLKIVGAVFAIGGIAELVGFIVK